MDPWAIAAFFASQLMTILGFVGIAFLNRQQNGEKKQTAQGETLAGLAQRITDIEESRRADGAQRDREAQALVARLDRKRTDIDETRSALTALSNTVQIAIAELKIQVAEINRSVERMSRIEERAHPQADEMAEALARALKSIARVA